MSPKNLGNISKFEFWGLTLVAYKKGVFLSWIDENCSIFTSVITRNYKTPICIQPKPQLLNLSFVVKGESANASRPSTKFSHVLRDYAINLVKYKYNANLFHNDSTLQCFMPISLQYIWDHYVFSPKALKIISCQFFLIFSQLFSKWENFAVSNWIRIKQFLLTINPCSY